MNKHNCITCANRGTIQNGSPACGKFKILINPEKDFCSWHILNSKSTCAFCEATESLILENLNDSYYYLCQEHYLAFHSCQGCANSTDCAFDKDVSEPHFIPQTLNQNGMIIRTQIKNPNLIEKHCSSCRCSYQSTNCIKDLDSPFCQNWIPKKELFQ